MQILIDGDACNKIAITEKIAQSNKIPCHIYCDTSRIIETTYAEVHIVDACRDSADFAILNKCRHNDIVITNDSGLAAMVLAKRAFALNSHGFEYTDANIMTYLNKRHMRKHTASKTNKKQVKGVMKATTPRLPYSKLLQTLIHKAERNVSDYA